MSTHDYDFETQAAGGQDPYGPPPPAPAPPPRRSLLLKKITWRDALVILGIAVMRLWVVQTVIVDGNSMSPTLANDERVLVLHPLHPHRFSVVVFTDPRDQTSVIKRVVGLPGDKVSSVVVTPPRGPGSFPESRLEVNGTEYSEPYAPVTVGTIPGGEMPAERYYVLGDNRQNSEDSRSSRYRPIPASSIQGVAVAVVYPFSHMRILTPTAEPIRDPEAAAAP